MADVSDAEDAVVNVIVAALYADGVGAGITSSAGIIVDIGRGWPSPNDAQKAVGTGRAVVSVSQQPGHTRNVTRYQSDAKIANGAQTTPSLTVSVIGNTATFGGQATVGQAAGVQVIQASAPPVNYVYRTQASETPASVAASLAEQIVGATVSGPSLTVPGLQKAVTAVDVQMIQELQRDEQAVRIVIWAPTQPSRDALGTQIRAAFAATKFLNYPDGSAGRCKFAQNFSSDISAQVKVWRRDIVLEVEIPTVIVTTVPQLLFMTGVLNVSVNPKGIAGGADIVEQFGSLPAPTEVYEDSSGDIILDQAGNLLSTP